MTREELDTIMEGDADFDGFRGKSRVMLGLNLITKYIPNPNISPAHDIIYVCDVDSLLQAGLTEEDARELCRMNWMIDSECDCFAIFT